MKTIGRYLRLLPLLGLLFVHAAPAADKEADKIEEYTRQLQKLSPRDADGFFKLGVWCEEQVLSDKAAKAFEQAIRIDPDHAEARAKLGYRPHGLGWTQGSAPVTVTATVTSERSGAAVTSAAPESASGSAPPRATPAAKAARVGGGAKDAGAKTDAKGSDAKGTDSKTVPPPGEARPSPADDAKPDASKVDAALAAKKQWAQEAAAKLEMKFSLYEDEDFLIHSTYESSSPKLKALVTTLKGLKAQIIKYVGKPKGPIWPGKLQFIFMRASTECMRFAEAIDATRFPEESGILVGGEAPDKLHMVLGALLEQTLAEILGRTSLDNLGGSNRYVGWWVKAGVGGLVSAETVEGKANRVLEQAFTRAGSELQANFDGVSVFKVLEIRDPRSAAAELGEAQAITLVYFLNRTYGASKFHQLVQDLKSAEAPAPPAGEDKLFFSKYSAYQESRMKAIYREGLEKLNEKWKAFVQTQAADLEKNQKPDSKKKSSKQAKGAGGKGAGGKGAGGKGAGGTGGGDRDNG